MYLFITKCTYVYVWKEIVNMSIGWAPDMIGWACAQPFPTLATPLFGTKSFVTSIASHLRFYNVLSVYR